MEGDKIANFHRIQSDFWFKFLLCAAATFPLQSQLMSFDVLDISKFTYASDSTTKPGSRLAAA